MKNIYVFLFLIFRHDASCLPISFVITWNNIKKNQEFSAIRDVTETYSNCGEHPSENI